MTVTNKHVIWAVEADAALIGGIVSQSVRIGTEVRGEPASGEVYPRALYEIAQKPGGAFATKAIAAAIDACPVTGKNIGDLTTGLKLYGQKHAAGGQRAGATSHRKYTFNDGLWLPRQLTVDHRGDAVLTFDVVAIYDGANDPVVVTDSVSLPAGITDAERFTLGPCTLASLAFAQMTRLQIDFGIAEALESADSDVWDTFGSIETIKPTLTITGTDVTWFGSAKVPIEGLDVAHATTAFYLRKRAAGASQFVADETAEHIKFTAAGLAHVTTAFEAADQAGSTIEIQMPLYYDGTNSPLTVDTTSAIT